jgi:hypothetical protein
VRILFWSGEKNRQISQLLRHTRDMGDTRNGYRILVGTFEILTESLSRGVRSTWFWLIAVRIKPPYLTLLQTFLLQGRLERHLWNHSKCFMPTSSRSMWPYEDRVYVQWSLRKLGMLWHGRKFHYTFSEPPALSRGGQYLAKWAPVACCMGFVIRRGS